MKKLFTIILSFMLYSLSFGQAFPFDWIQHEGSNKGDYAYDMYIDADGNRYITGKFYGTLDFGNGVTITPENNYDCYVAKYDSENNIIWARAFGGYSADEGRAVVADTAGNVIVASAFFNTITFGTDTLVGHGNFDIAVVKFDAYGNYLWMKQAYTVNQDKPADLKVDSEGNYVLLGYYDVNDSLTLPLVYENLQITSSNGERDVFVIKMDSDGNPLWGISGGGAGNDYPGQLVIDENDNIYFNGNYADAPGAFGPFLLPFFDGSEMFVAKLNPNGEYQWVTAGFGSGDEKGYALEYVSDIDGEGMILAAGAFEDTLVVGELSVLPTGNVQDNTTKKNKFFSTQDEGPGIFISNGDYDIYAVGLKASTGLYDGGVSYGGYVNDEAKAIVYVPGSDGDFFIAGISKGEIRTQDFVLPNYGKRDVFIMHFHQDHLIWAKNYGGNSDEYLNSAMADNNGNIYFAGNFKSTPADFSPYILQSRGSYDIWFGQMHLPSPLGNPTICSITDIPNDQGGKVRIEICGSEIATSFSVWREIKGTQDWESVGSFDGVYKDRYYFVAPTLGDSTADGIYYSVFRVSEHTGNPLLFAVSPADSGYSIDNLAPAVPSGVMATGHENKVELAWDNNNDADFKYYAIYRSVDPSFIPDTMSTYTYTTIETNFEDSNVELGNTYYYVVVAVDFAGNQSEFSNKVSAMVTDVNDAIEIPNVYSLGQNYPNPFNPTTAIKFGLPQSSEVHLAVYNTIGEKVAELVNGNLTAGYHTVNFDASNFASGMYIYRITAGKFTSVKKMMLLK